MRIWEQFSEVRQKLLTGIKNDFKARIFDYGESEGLIDINLTVKNGIIGLSVIYDESGCWVEYPVLWLSKDNESILVEIYKICIILQQLYKITGNYPKVEVYENASSKDGDMRITYYFIKLNESAVLHVLDAFSRVDLGKMNIDKDFLERNYHELYQLYLSKIDEEHKKFQNYMESDWRKKQYNVITYKTLLTVLFCENDYVFTNYQGNILVGFTREGFEKYIKTYKLELNVLKDYYEGLQYNIKKNESEIIVWEKRLWEEGKNILCNLELNRGDLPAQFSYSKDRVFIQVIDFWVCVMTEANNIQRKINEEKLRLRESQKNFINNTSEQVINIEYDLNNLNPDKFEKMCCDLLMAEGFKNIYRRGNANTADGGVDIEAVEEIAGIIKKEERKWIFQCKATNKQLDRRDIAEIPCLLKEFKAEGYGIFYSNVLKPSTLDRLKTIDIKNIWIYDINAIKQKLREHQAVAEKYFPLLEL